MPSAGSRCRRVAAPAAAGDRPDHRLAAVMPASGVLWAWHAGRPLPVLLAVGMALGRATAVVAWAADGESCAAKLPSGRVQLRVRLLEPVPVDGGLLGVRPVSAGCRGPVTARWPAGDPRPAGTVTQVDGTWTPRAGVAGRAGGLLLVRGAAPGAGVPSLSETVR